MKRQIAYYFLLSTVLVIFNTLVFHASATSFQRNDDEGYAYLQSQNNHQETQSTYNRFSKDVSPRVAFSPTSFNFKKSCHEIIQHHDYLYILHFLHKNDEHVRHQQTSFCHDPVNYYIFTLEKIVI